MSHETGLLMQLASHRARRISKPMARAQVLSHSPAPARGRAEHGFGRWEGEEPPYRREEVVGSRGSEGVVVGRTEEIERLGEIIFFYLSEANAKLFDYLRRISMTMRDASAAS